MGLKIGWFSDLIILIPLVEGLIKTQKSLWKKIIAEIIRIAGGHFQLTYSNQRETHRPDTLGGKKALATKHFSPCEEERSVVPQPDSPRSGIASYPFLWPFSSVKHKLW